MYFFTLDEKVTKPSVLGEMSEYEVLRNDVLHMGRDLGVHDVEGQRVLQVKYCIVNCSCMCYKEVQISKGFILFGQHFVSLQIFATNLFWFQVAMIIRNLSFEEENMAFLASNLLVFR